MLTALCLLASTAAAGATEPLTWSVDGTLGGGVALPSSEGHLLGQEGYSRLRSTWSLEGSYFFLDRLGLSAWGGMTHSGSDADNGGPHISEDITMIALGVPVLAVSSRQLLVRVTPRFGLAWQTLQFYGTSPYGTAQAHRTTLMGLEVSVVSRVAHIGGFVRAISAPLGSRPGASAGDQAGGVYIGWEGWFGG